MKTEIKSYKNVLIYLVSGVLNRSIPFFMIPILTYYLSTEEYGIWSVFQAFLLFIIPLVKISSGAQISRIFFKVEKSELAEYVTCLIANSVFISVILVILFYLFDLFSISFPFNFPSTFLLIIPLVALVNAIHQLNIILFRNEKNAVYFGIHEILYSFLYLTSAYFFIKYFDLGWKSMVYGALLSSSILSIVAFIRFSKNKLLNFKFNFKRIASIFSFGILLTPNALSSVVITLSDRLFIDYFADSSTVAIYSIGYTISMIVVLFSESLIKVWTPWLFEQLSFINAKKKNRIVQLFYLYAIGVSLFALCLYLVSPLILKIMTTELYYGASKYLLYIIIGFVFNSMYTLIFPFSVYLGKTKVLSSLTFGVAIINLVLNYVLIKEYGAKGAAISTMIVYGLKFILVFIYTNRIYKMPWFNFSLINTK